MDLFPGLAGAGRVRCVFCAFRCSRSRRASLGRRAQHVRSLSLWVPIGALHCPFGSALSFLPCLRPRRLLSPLLSYVCGWGAGSPVHPGLCGTPTAALLPPAPRAASCSPSVCLFFLRCPVARSTRARPSSMAAGSPTRFCIVLCLRSRPRRFFPDPSGCFLPDSVVRAAYTVSASPALLVEPPMFWG